MVVNIAQSEVLARTLMRKKRPQSIKEGVNLGKVLKEILDWANKLVPSEGGSILLDDPLLKMNPRIEGRLYFAACFGKNTSMLAGTSISINVGIAGETYRSGKSYICKDTSKDSHFLHEIDNKIRHYTKSIVCAPILIKEAVIGVIELVNRKGKTTYDKTDLALLEIFAGYTATLMENALAAMRFEELSKHDHLTGLFNDRYFFLSLEHVISQAIRNKGDTALIFFDLDRFKEVNDTHGHLAGSRVLKEIADILRRILSGIPSISSRYGGDEFTIILPETGIDEAISVAELVRTSIMNNTFLSRKGIHGEPAYKISGLITCSVGVASITKHVKRERSMRRMTESLIKAADRAMYCAKENGKNKVCIPEDEEIVQL